MPRSVVGTAESQPVSFNFKNFFNNNILKLNKFAKKKLFYSKRNGLILFAVIRRAWRETYPPTGYDVFKKSYNGKEVSFSDPVRNIIDSKLIDALSFFGFPTNIADPEACDGKLTVTQVIKNFFGWQSGEHLSAWQRFYNKSLILPFIYFIFTLITTIASFAINVVKLVTEFLPTVLEKLTFLAAGRLRHSVYAKTNHPVLKGIVGAAIGVLLFLHLTFKLVRIVGRIITSPTTSAYAAWLAGKNLFGENWAGRFVGGIFATISLALTILAYIFLPPLAIAKIPAMAIAVKQAVLWLTSKPVIAAISDALAKVFNPIFLNVMRSFGVKFLPSLGVVATNSITVTAAMTIRAIVVAYVKEIVATLRTGLAIVQKGLALLTALFLKPPTVVIAVTEPQLTAPSTPLPKSESDVPPSKPEPEPDPDGGAPAPTQVTPPEQLQRSSSTTDIPKLEKESVPHQQRSLSIKNLPRIKITEPILPQKDTTQPSGLPKPESSVVMLLKLQNASTPEKTAPMPSNQNTDTSTVVTTTTATDANTTQIATSPANNVVYLPPASPGRAIRKSSSAEIPNSPSMLENLDGKYPVQTSLSGNFHLGRKTLVTLYKFPKNTTPSVPPIPKETQLVSQPNSGQSSMQGTPATPRPPRLSGTPQKPANR